MSTTVLMHGPPLRLAGEGSSDHSDPMLLDRFLRGSEIDAEEAFRELMFRHGPMVLAVCRQALNGSHDAEDAFQATFLTLARKASTIRDPQYLAGWLCEVAHRIALRSRGATARRRVREARVLAMSDAADPPEGQDQASRQEIRQVIQEEVHGLPEKYRSPVILYYFEGRSNEEVAEVLDWPVGTVKGRLSRARDLLRSRLRGRSVALSAAFLLLAIESESAGAAEVETSLAEAALRTSLGARTTSRPDAADPTRHSRKPGTRRLLVSLFLLALAASAVGSMYRGAWGRLGAGGLYEGAASLVPFPVQPASHCH